jgi:hypothetical protein
MIGISLKLPRSFSELLLYNSFESPSVWVSCINKLTYDRVNYFEIFNKMFSLLSGFYEYIFSKPVFKVLMVGLDGAGKTTLLEHVKSIEG